MKIEAPHRAGLLGGLVAICTISIDKLLLNCKQGTRFFYNEFGLYFVVYA